MIRTLPYVEGGKLFRPGRMGDPIMIGTPAWFEWLDRHAVFTFSDAAVGFTAYKRPPFAADSPWFTSHKRDGRHERLRDAVRALAAQPEAIPAASMREQARADLSAPVTPLPGQRPATGALEEFVVILSVADMGGESLDHATHQTKRGTRNRVRLAQERKERPDRRNERSPLTEEREREIQIATGVQALSAVAAARDGYTALHAHRLVGLAVATAQQLGQPEEDLHLLRLGAILHDIGKIGIPDAILFKPGPLTEEEQLIMRRHPDVGEHILRQIGGVFQQLAAVVVAHHERWDGMGYPRRLAGEAIPLHARILAVVDAYDAMISLRVYRRSMTTGQARAELLRCSGTQFDPQVVEAFLRALNEHETSLQGTMQLVPV